MAGTISDTEILTEIKDKHLPFIKKLLSYFEKKKEKSQKHDDLRSLHNTFTTAPVKEQVKVYNANKKKLDKWYKMYEQMSKSKKRGASNENDSSQEATESGSLAKQRKLDNNVQSSSTPGISIVSYRSVPEVNASNVVSSTSNTTVPGQNAVNKSVSEQAVSSDQDPVVFVCASCQFNTLNEAEFAQHAKNDHKNELSLWCKMCWRCFSNIGALTSHIKERSCQKEEMIYKCGVKDCTFEVSSGQTFVHHLRHCHKGSPFIFCVHCQKIFTLPHCLVLHMQNECPYKDRNRKTGGSSESSSNAPQPPTPIVQSQPTPTLAPARALTPAARGSTAVTPAPMNRSALKTPALTTVTSVQKGQLFSRGRGRGGGGRGRGRVRFSDSSDSEDADDPSWMPDPNSSSLPVRRSARWAKKVSDARNPDFFEPESQQPRKKSISSSEIRENNLLSCPGCDYTAAIKSVLEDHIIGIHKAPDKNACLICNVKFENVKFFLDHFENHPKVDIPKPPEPVVTPAPKKPAYIPKPASLQSSNISNTTPVTTPVAKITPVVETRTPTVTNTVVTTSTYLTKSHEALGIDGDGLECVVESVISGNENVDVTRGEPLITIPYQAAIHKKNQKDAKLKKFEDLKSPRDLLKLKEEPNLRHFFKCVMYNCTFTSDEGDTFAFHIDNDHKGRRLHCGYCLTEYFSGAHLKEHMLKDHGKRRYQCSNCFYRACSKAHVQIHIKNMHPNEDARIHVCEAQPAVNDAQDSTDATKTWPFVCAVGDCKFQTFVPQEFKRHNETVHRSVSVFICYYCKVDFISFKRLMDHYRLHGINTFQCTYCVHGSDTKDEILLHLCNAHADKPFRVHFRTAEENVPGGTIQSIRVSGTNSSKDENLSTARAPANENSIPAVVQQVKLPSSKATEDTTDFALKGIKQEKEDDSIEDKFYDQVQGKCFPKTVQRISSDFFCGISFCDQQFDDISIYINHLKKIHFALNFSCPHCPTFSEDFISFKDHLLSHGPNLFACSNNTCNFYNWDSGKVSDHVKEHLDMSTKIVVRESIGDTSEKVKASNELAKIQAASCENIFKASDDCFNCPFCEYKSSHQGTMKNHIYMEISYKRFTCNVCLVKFCSRKELSTHFSALHPNENINSNTSISVNPEIEHLVKKFLINEAKFHPAASYACENCSKTFTSLHKWQHHLSLCLLNNYCPYDCNYCKRSFSDLRILKFHFDSRHMANDISFTTIISSKAEEEINRKLQQSRLNHLKKVLEKEELSSKNIMQLFEKYKSKSYKCQCCSYKSQFKIDIENHVANDHADKNWKAEKVEENIKISLAFNIPTNESKNILKTSVSVADKRYQCSYCVKKLYNLPEFENHVQYQHSIQDQIDYTYFYWPEDNQDFSPNDTELFECGYCNVSKANLHSLKNHCDMLHSEMAFKVKGHMSRPKEMGRNIMCGHCYQRMPYSDLKKHTNSCHNSLPVSFLNDFQNVSLKRKLLAEPVSSPKKIKFEPSAVSCAHCGGVFPTVQQVTSHSQRHHARLPLKYESLSEKPKAGDPKDFVFIKCEFCPFISNMQLLEKHMASKHKMVVSCTYCGMRFDSATKLKEHHDAAHKGMRWTFDSSKTYTSPRSPKKGFSSAMEDQPSESCYGKSPEPVDLQTVTFCMTNSSDQYFTLPIVYLFQFFNMNPVVVVKDCSAEKK